MASSSSFFRSLLQGFGCFGFFYSQRETENEKQIQQNTMQQMSAILSPLDKPKGGTCPFSNALFGLTVQQVNSSVCSSLQHLYSALVDRKSNYTNPPNGCINNFLSKTREMEISYILSINIILALPTCFKHTEGTS